MEPYATERLDVGDGHRLYVEQSGNPEGKPVVLVHGGPGGGSSPAMRRFHDPERYRIIVFDQRGCGRSRPHASAPRADLSTNTTWHLVADLERIREHLGVSRWQVWGGSWGSTLALAYAQRHPERVSELVLRGIFTLRRAELDWYYNGPAGFIAPEWRERFLAPLGPGFTGDAIEAYHRLLADPDPAVHGPAGVAWTNWENATVTLRENPALLQDESEPAYAVAFARIENHYFRHAGWLEEGQLIRDARVLRDIPAVLIQGRYDLATPAVTAHDLHRAWPEADLQIVLAGHSAFEPEIAAALIAAGERFAER